jgi:hypothetical protein
MRVQARSRSVRRRLAAVVLAMAMVTALAACGDDDNGGDTSATPTSGGGTSTPGTKAQLQEFGTGVSETSVKLGVVLINYDVIADFIDFARGDQEAIYKAIIEDFNAKGGLESGQKIEPVFHTYVPIGSAGPVEACTKLIEDEKVFATIGVLIDSSGAAHLCFTEQHDSILITHELSEATVKKAKPGQLLTPDILAERLTRTLLKLAKDQGKLEGKKFGILAETGTQSRIKDAIQPAMDELGIEYGSDGVLTTGDDTDTTAALAQLDSLIERWKGENVNAFFISGLAAVSKAYVTKIKDAFPDGLIVTDGDASAKGAGQDAEQSGTDPNPYVGTLALVGLTSQQQFEQPQMQECKAIWEKASGETVVAPDDLEPNADGKREEIWITARDACTELYFFAAIANRVGTFLNNENWADAVNNFGSATDLFNTSAASLGEGKYDADNNFSLVEFDPTVGSNGDWKALTPLQDVTKSG